MWGRIWQTCPSQPTLSATLNSWKCSEVLWLIWKHRKVTSSTFVFYSLQVFQEIHTCKTITTTWSCVLHSHFSAISLFKALQKLSYLMLYQAEVFWINHKKYFVTKLPDWQATPKHDLSKWYWTSPSKLLSTQLFQMHVTLLVQMRLELKILLLHPTHLFLEGNVTEPIWNPVWHVYLSQALPSLCSLLPSLPWVHQKNIFLQQSTWIPTTCTRTCYGEKLISEEPCCRLLPPWCQLTLDLNIHPPTRPDLRGYLEGSNISPVYFFILMLTAQQPSFPSLSHLSSLCPHKQCHLKIKWYVRTTKGNSET